MSEPDSTSESVSGPIGAWIIGARGSVATTTVTGAAAIGNGLAPPTGLVTGTSGFADAGLPELDEIVFGGHDVVETPLAMRAARLVDGGVLPSGLPEALGDQLAESESNLRAGIGWHEARTSPRAAVDRVAADIEEFRSRHGLRHVVVIDVASTEPPAEPHESHASADALLAAVDRNLAILPPSSLYALAAIESDCAFLEFTPSTGPCLPGLLELAERAGVPIGGSDGKTGETMLKSALAPAFASRALRVRSWSGTNLLGGGDGEALAHPERARSKLASKGRCLDEILGYPVEAPVRIEHVRDLGEWKTAWDNIAFEGFLGVRMKMQFTWEGCDSALAAPLLIDLVRLGALAKERGAAGPQGQLGFFFKDPIGSDVHDLNRQYQDLRAWVLERVEA